MTDRDEVEALLADGRLAVVGVSVSAHDPTRVVLRALAALGRPLVVVRPGVSEIGGVPAYPRVRDVPGRLDGVVVMTVPRAVEEVVDECAAAGRAAGLGRSGVQRPASTRASSPTTAATAWSS